MPIYAPTLPPKPEAGGGQHPVRILMRFDLRRILTQKLGIFFIVIFTGILLIQLIVLYMKHLMNTNEAMGAMAGALKGVMTQGAAYQAGHIDNWVLTPLWFLLATIGGGLIARDTLYRVRPLMYAHPLRHREYLLAKVGFAGLVPFAVMLPFYMLPWLMSILIAGTKGPVWASLPLHLIPATTIVALLMGAVTVGAGAMASSPRAAFGWLIGIVLGTFAMGGILAGVLHNREILAMSPAVLVTAWPQLLCGVEQPLLSLGSAIAGTAIHVGLWIFIAYSRTRPSEATL